MSNNNFKYRFCKASEQSLRASTEGGYAGGNFSADNLLVVGDKGDQDTSLGALSTPVKPSWMGALPDWPFASHAEVLIEIVKVETSEGAKDRWLKTQVTP